jgi:hypothetical protein
MYSFLLLLGHDTTGMNRGGAYLGLSPTENPGNRDSRTLLVTPTGSSNSRSTTAEDSVKMVAGRRTTIIASPGFASGPILLSAWWR